MCLFYTRRNARREYYSWTYARWRSTDEAFVCCGSSLGGARRCGSGGRSAPWRSAVLLQGAVCTPGIQLERILHRRERWRRVRKLGVGHDQLVQHDRRRGRRHGRLQLSDRSGCARRRRRYRLERHQGHHHHRRLPGRLHDQRLHGFRPCVRASAMRPTASCPMSPAAVRSGT